MVKQGKASINTILLGSTLGELADKLGDIQGDVGLLVIAVYPDKVRIECSVEMSKPEVIGALYMAIDEVANEGDNA